MCGLKKHGNKGPGLKSTFPAFLIMLQRLIIGPNLYAYLWAEASRSTPPAALAGVFHAQVCGKEKVEVKF